MAITISGENNNDRILASDGVIDSLSGFNVVGVITATSFTGDLTGDVTGNLTGNVTGNINNTTLLLQTGGTERVRVTSTGNIGLGVASPQGGGGDLSILGNKALRWSNSGGTQYGDIYADTSSNIVFRNGSSSTERLRITSAGDVGIGYNSPTVKLHVREAASGTSSYDNRYHMICENNGEAYLGFYVPDNQYAGIRFVDTTGLEGTIDYYFSDDEMHFHSSAKHIFKTGGTERLRITSDGKIGVNNDNPAYPLEVFGDGGGAFAASTNSAHGQLSIVGKNSSGQVSAISRIKSYPDGSSSRADMAFETRNSSSQMVERLRLDSSGNIRVIGNQTGNNVGILYNSSAGFGMYGSASSSNNRNLIFYSNSGSSSERLRITSTGQVLIGETSVAGGSQQLVIGNGGAENFEFTSGASAQNGGVLEYIHRGDGSTRPDLSMYVGGGAFKVYTGGNNERFRIASNGEVWFKDGKLKLGTTSGTDNYIYSTNAAGIIYQADENGHRFQTYAGGWQDRLIIKDDGKIDIGGSTKTGNAARLTVTHTNNSGVGLIDIDAYGSATLQIRSNWSGSTINGMPNETFGFGTPHQYPLVFTTHGTERFRITSDGYLNFYNDSNTNKGLRWYNNVGGSAKAASIEWGNGNANWEFKHFRNDNQADNPYANIDFFTGDYSSPTRALRITNDGNHIREKHSRFATRIDYSSSNESANVRLTFKSPHVNVGSDFSSSRYTAPVDGTYAFWFHTNVQRSGGAGYYLVHWYKNGSNVSNNAGGNIYDQHTGSGWNNLSGCIMLALQEGDYIEVYNGSQVANYDGNNYGQFMGWLVG